jgi:carbamoyl-phosphate synthase large subunit
MAGTSLKDQGFTEEIVPTMFNVKEAVFPFNKFQGVDPILGPEMKSTGEVMGAGETFAEAYSKAQVGSGERLPTKGTAFLSVRDADKEGIVGVARELEQLGFNIVATGGTHAVIAAAGISSERINKVTEGRPHTIDMLKNGEIDLIINTTEGKQAIADSASIRRQALAEKVVSTTTLAGGYAVCEAIKFGEEKQVRTLQEMHGE